ncbi:hypothetical protein H8957_009280 [Semnopithecus entellus]
MQPIGNTFSESRVASRSPSVGLDERNQVATMPVRLLRDSPPAQENNDHARDGFQMKMDAHGFAPEELVVQVDGQWLMVTGQRQLDGSAVALALPEAQTGPTRRLRSLGSKASNLTQ